MPAPKYFHARTKTNSCPQRRDKTILTALGIQVYDPDIKIKGMGVIKSTQEQSVPTRKSQINKYVEITKIIRKSAPDPIGLRTRNLL